MTNSLRPALVDSLELFHVGKPREALVKLFTATRQQPKAEGAADALYHLGIFSRELGNRHQEELFYLAAHSVRDTAIARKTVFNNLVNLTRVCIDLRSFREASSYGLLAERIHDDDADLLGNLVAVSVLLEAPDRELRIERLRAVDPVKLAELGETLTGKNKGFQPTRQLDGSDLVRRFESAAGRLDALLPLVLELQERPDCVGAARCWRLLADAYDTAARPGGSGLEAVLTIAGIVAASGKAINASSDRDANDSGLQAKNQAALERLGFNDPTPPRVAAPAQSEPARGEALRRELTALFRSDLGGRRAGVETLRTRVATTRNDPDRAELELALALALGFVAFETIDKRREIAELRAGHAAAQEGVERLARLAERVGKDRADELARLLTSGDFNESYAHALSELAHYEGVTGDLATAEQLQRSAISASPFSPKLRSNLASLLIHRERTSDRPDAGRRLAILEELEEAQRNGPYASIARVLDDLLELPALSDDCLQRAASLRRAIELGVPPPPSVPSARPAARRGAQPLTHDEHYRTVSAKAQGRPIALALASVQASGPFVALVYRRKEPLSHREADDLDTRVRAYIACAIYDAAIGAGLSCRKAPPHGSRPAWLIGNRSVPTSIVNAGFDAEDRECFVEVGPGTTRLDTSSVAGEDPVAVRIAVGFEKCFNEILV
jgi:hypothetical protein